MHRHGFTIVELLIVIVVIAILAAISIVTYTGIQARAQATAIVSGLNQIDRSMRLWAVDEGFSTWPHHYIASGGMPLSELIEENPSLQAYLQGAPEVQGIHTDEWFYDNDSDTKTNCGNNYNGVNIVIRYVTDTAVAQMVDDYIDDGNLNCGKVRYTDQRIFYSISYGPTVGG